MTEEMCKEKCTKTPENESDLKRIETKVDNLERRSFLIRNYTYNIRSSLKGPRPSEDSKCEEKAIEPNRLQALNDKLIDINTIFDEIEKTLSEIHEVVE